MKAAIPVSSARRAARFTKSRSPWSNRSSVSLRYPYTLPLSVSPFTRQVRSGNRDNCLMLQLSSEVDFAMTFERPDVPRSCGATRVWGVAAGRRYIGACGVPRSCGLR